MQTVSMPVETVNKVLNYLASQSYSQVAELISEIQSSAVLNPVEEKPEQDESAE